MTQDAFSEDEKAALLALAQQIIPDAPPLGQPGADDPRIFADILKSAAPSHTALAAPLAALSKNAPLDAAEADAFRHAFADAANLVQSIVAQCYYRDPRVMRALNIDVRPPFPKGYIQEPNDLSLLDPVRARGPIYRKTGSTRHEV